MSDSSHSSTENSLLVDTIEKMTRMMIQPLTTEKNDIISCPNKIPTTKRRSRPLVATFIDNEYKNDQIFEEKQQVQDYSTKKLAELIAICKEMGIKGYSGKKKDEIITLIESFSEKSHTSKNVELVESMSSTTNNILSCDYWKNTKTFKSIKDKETQIKYYKRMNASEEVLQLVELESKPFGSESEKIISEIFHLGARTSTQNDGTCNGKKIEIKSARYWAGKDNCVWQHLEPDHDYEFALLVILDFQGWKVWCIKKSLLMGEMREKNIVTFQGKQGWWTRKSAILPYLTPITTLAELQAFVQ